MKSYKSFKKASKSRLQKMAKWMSYQEIADLLNREGYRNQHGNPISATNVGHRLMVIRGEQTVFKAETTLTPVPTFTIQETVSTHETSQASSTESDMEQLKEIIQSNLSYGLKKKFIYELVK